MKKIIVLLCLLSLLTLNINAAKKPRYRKNLKFKRKLSYKEFKKLPNNKMLIVGKKKMTKRQLMAKVNKIKKQARKANNKFTLKKLRVKLKQKKQAELKKENNKIEEYAKNFKMKSLKPGKCKFKVPKITGIFMVPPISPGEEIFIKGECFGKLKKDNGKSMVKLLINQNEYRSDGSIRKTKEKVIALKIKKWKSEFIQAKIPLKFNGGYPDQPGKVVVKASYQTSNKWPVQFEAKRVVRLASGFQIACHPFTPRNSDSCKENVTSISNLHGSHNFKSFEASKDMYSISLKNKWRLHHVGKIIFGPVYAVANNLTAVAVKGFVPWSTSNQFEVNWIYVGSGGVRYDLGVFMIGPKGIPHK